MHNFPPTSLKPVREAKAWDQAFTSGRTVTVTFQGRNPEKLAVDENVAYGVVPTEAEGVVTLSLTLSGVLRTGGGRKARPGWRYRTWALTARLEKPLGDRMLVDGSNGEERLSTQLETRLEPTWIPDWLTLAVGGRHLPQQYTKFAMAHDLVTPSIELLMSPITMRPRLHGLRQFDDFGTVTIRRKGDGVVAIDHFGGRFVVGFEEQGWYYRLTTSQDIESELLVHIARSFERPALVDQESLPLRLTVPVFDIAVQPGQR